MSDADRLPAIEVLADHGALADACADLIAKALEQAITDRGRAAFAATGGSTPAATYRRLGEARLDWSKVDITLTDERWVRPSSMDSNERMVRDSLLHGPPRAAGFVPLWSDVATPEEAARAVEPRLKAFLPFDLVLLGMGEDGHIASLFPGNPALAEGLDAKTERLCLAVPAGDPAPAQPRISLSLRALLDARAVFLLVTGEAKRQTLERAAGGADLPVRRLIAQQSAPVRVLWSR